MAKQERKGPTRSKGATSAASVKQDNGVDPALLQGVRWRPIGPFRGGRVVAVAGSPAHDLVYYFGATGGGVWKTTDAGVSWRNVSDGYFQTASVGALAVAESDPNVIYAGMGESTIRGNVAQGDGVYRSTDAGQTWSHCGLADTRTIGRVRVDPRDPDVVYVAALGHIFGPHPERGVYRSRDGGRNWQQVLARGDRTGAVDLALDPHNPRVLYASFWEAGRTPYSLSSGGPGSGLWKSTDGGDSWTDLTGNPGLPAGLKGRIGVTVSPARPGRVWALVEAAEGGLFRSDDAGATWRKLSDDQELRQRAWYYSHVVADTESPDTVYVLNVRFLKSTDGGRTFLAVPTPHGDNHDLWIDPRDNQRMIEGNDGGACITFDGGLSWSSIYNQPTAEFYHVTTDNQVPYRVYGAQQDNTTICLPSRSDNGAITFGEAYPVGGGESGYIAVRPDDPNVVYAGSYGGLTTRYDHRTRQTRNIAPWPDNPMGYGARDIKYRFQWTFPIVLSPHDPNVLYATANQVFRSTDEGASWEIVSPDLTRNDTSKMGPSGGPLTKDNTSVEYYGTIFTFAESPLTPGLLWAGSDDGLIHLSRDNGQTWTNVTPRKRDLPEWALISIIEPSPHDPAVAYVAATRYKLDDVAPYLLRTDNYGKSWRRIDTGIAENAFTRVIRADPRQPGLLYAGTETGVYLSFDNGAQWQPLQGNLPVVPIHDLAVKDDDLIAATHGRSFWILDDLTLLHQFATDTDGGPARLFAPRATIRYRGGMRRTRLDPDNPRNFQSAGGQTIGSLQVKGVDGEEELTFLDAGQNPPSGVVVQYALAKEPTEPLTLTFRDAAGEVIKSFTSKPRPATAPSSDTAEPPAAETQPAPPREGEEQAPVEQTATESAGHEERKEPAAPARPGLNRFVWNLRYPDARDVKGAVMWAGSVDGPLAPPGSYSVELAVDALRQQVSFDLLPDPRVSATPDDFAAQFAFLLRCRDKLTEIHDAVNQIRDLRRQLDDWTGRTKQEPRGQEVAVAARALRDQLTAIEGELLQVRSKAHEDPLNFPIKLNNRLAALAGIVASADAAPTAQSHTVYDLLVAQIDDQLARLRAALERDLDAFNQLLRDAAVPAVVALPPAQP